ncbi:unnamed protein product [Cyprideis torosa]|uniref:Uncharacterized protein n=1 Tax=Cyprideis torosa TaxID=163714 RepID=A0A7R8W1U8_9CRUS|nr:unnamed protein product [Cyprideis torosa]CAG0881301.1 unnamed protein product [Cyprideis torosa]
MEKKYPNIDDMMRSYVDLSSTKEPAARRAFQIPLEEIQSIEIPALFISLSDTLRFAADSPFTDPVRVYSLFLQSRLPREVLAHIWSLVNRHTPGTLTVEELHEALALIALAQHGHPLTPGDAASIFASINKIPEPSFYMEPLGHRPGMAPQALTTIHSAAQTTSQPLPFLTSQAGTSMVDTQLLTSEVPFSDSSCSGVQDEFGDFVGNSGADSVDDPQRFALPTALTSTAKNDSSQSASPQSAEEEEDEWNDFVSVTPEPVRKNYVAISHNVQPMVVTSREGSSKGISNGSLASQISRMHLGSLNSSSASSLPRKPSVSRKDEPGIHRNLMDDSSSSPSPQSPPSVPLQSNQIPSASRAIRRDQTFSSEVRSASSLSNGSDPSPQSTNQNDPSPQSTNQNDPYAALRDLELSSGRESSAPPDLLCGGPTFPPDLVSSSPPAAVDLLSLDLVSSQPQGRPMDLVSSQPQGRPMDLVSSQPEGRPMDLVSSQPEGRPMDLVSSQPQGRPMDLVSSQPQGRPMDLVSSQPQGRPMDLVSSQPEGRPMDLVSSQPEGRPMDLVSSQPEGRPMDLVSSQPQGRSGPVRLYPLDLIAPSRSDPPVSAAQPWGGLDLVISNTSAVPGGPRIPFPDLMSSGARNEDHSDPDLMAPVGGGPDLMAQADADDSFSDFVSASDPAESDRVHNPGDRIFATMSNAAEDELSVEIVDAADKRGSLPDLLSGFESLKASFSSALASSLLAVNRQGRKSPGSVASDTASVSSSVTGATGGGSRDAEDSVGGVYEDGVGMASMSLGPMGRQSSSEVDDRYDAFRLALGGEQQDVEASALSDTAGRSRETALVNSWERVVSVCLSLVTTGVAFFEGAGDDVTLAALLKEEEARDYLKNLQEVYLVGRRIFHASKACDRSSERLRQGEVELTRSWLVLKDFSIKAKLMEEDPTFSFSPFANSSGCGVCLLATTNKRGGLSLPTVITDLYVTGQTTDEASPVLAFNGRNYHCSCANLWINRLDHILPTLVL